MIRDPYDSLESNKYTIKRVPISLFFFMKPFLSQYVKLANQVYENHIRDLLI